MEQGAPFTALEGRETRKELRLGHPKGPRRPEQQEAGQEQEQFPGTGGRQGLWCIRCIGSGGIADKFEGQFKGSAELRFAKWGRAAEQTAGLQEDVLGIERVKTSEGGLEPRTVQLVGRSGTGLGVSVAWLVGCGCRLRRRLLRGSAIGSGGGAGRGAGRAGARRAAACRGRTDLCGRGVCSWRVRRGGRGWSRQAVLVRGRHLL